jgi:sugar phosphate isomerase/epimerase
MKSPLVSRRRFIQNAAVGLVAGAAWRDATAATPKTSWTLGCLNRPWVQWSADEMLDGVVAAGYRLVGLQTPTPTEPFNSPGASPAYLAALKQKIAARGLKANVGRLRTKDAAPFADATREIRQQVDHARALGLTTLVHTGTAKPADYEAWYRLMHYAAGYAADAGIQLVTKPHGGVNAAAAELLVCLEKINHRNLGIWYDAGNIIHYTGKDPLAELEPIVSHVTSFTAKDCAALKGEVMIQFGTGKVDFAALLGWLKKAGFPGTIMVETGAPGATPAEATANAAANRKFLEAVIAKL